MRNHPGPAVYPSRLLLVLALLLLGPSCQQKPATTEQNVQPSTPTYMEMMLPHLQQWGFDNRDPIVDLAGYRMSFQVFTKENTYGIAANKFTAKQDGNKWSLHATEFAWAAQQERAPGMLDVLAEKLDDGRVLLNIKAKAQKPVRGVKATLYGLPGEQTGWSADAHLVPVSEKGTLYQYPTWSGGMPLLLLADAQGKGIAFTSVDLQARPKRFAVTKEKAGNTVELIFEEDARHWAPELTAATWEIKPDTTLQQVVDARLAFLEAKGGLKKWEDRTDMPAWVRDISLVVSIHGMHWSGYIFNDYAKSLETVRWVTQRIEPKRVLVFLPGWEGRYYWDYGFFQPDPRMGGPQGFKKMIAEMHALGVHVMPMFGGNCTNAWFPGYEKFGPQSLLVSGTGWIDQGNGPDWDMFRNRDTGWQQWLNPGAPRWQDHLVGQIDGLLSEYKFDGVFFDTQPSPNNDARYNTLAGLHTICDRLRSRHPDLLLATESSNDLSISFVPVNHTPGGVNNWPGRYVRRFAYLAEAEPGRGSTGVEEDGYLPYDTKKLNQDYDWPTVSFVEDTLQVAPDKVQEVIDRAKQYAQTKLK